METPHLVSPASNPLIFFRFDLLADSLKSCSTSAYKRVGKTTNKIYQSELTAQWQWQE
jgi:hypothetical protein